MGLPEQHGKVRATVVEGTKRSHHHGQVLKHVVSGANVPDRRSSLLQSTQLAVHSRLPIMLRSTLTGRSRQRSSELLIAAQNQFEALACSEPFIFSNTLTRKTFSFNADKGRSREGAFTYAEVKDKSDDGQKLPSKQRATITGRRGQKAAEVGHFFLCPDFVCFLVPASLVIRSKVRTASRACYRKSQSNESVFSSHSNHPRSCFAFIWRRVRVDQTSRKSVRHSLIFSVIVVTASKLI